VRPLIAAMKLSLDGRSEGPAGYADWVEAWSEDYGLMDRIDACLLGGRMYPGYEQYWTAIREAPHQPLPMTGRLPHPRELTWSAFAGRTAHHVLSTTLQAVAWPHTRLLRSIADVAALKQAAGKGIYLMGGGTLLAGLADAGLVDEFHFIVHPLLAGRGRGPFEALQQRRPLALMDARALEGGLVRLAYRAA
jgi:dihydrofolate reductase